MFRMMLQPNGPTAHTMHIKCAFDAGKMCVHRPPRDADRKSIRRQLMSVSRPLWRIRLKAKVPKCSFRPPLKLDPQKLRFIT